MAKVIERPIIPGDMLPLANTPKKDAKKIKMLAKNSI